MEFNPYSPCLDFFVISSRDQRAYKKHSGLLDRFSKTDAQFLCCWKDTMFMLIKHENVFKKERLAFVFQVYKPLFEAVSDSSGGKTLEDVFYEREVWWKRKCS